MNEIMPAKVSSQQLAHRRALLEAQPTTKWINVVETTHGVPRQKRILVRNNIRDVDHLMMTMTNRLQPDVGAIRNLYTPAGGTQVTSLDQLNPDGCKKTKLLRSRNFQFLILLDHDISTIYIHLFLFFSIRCRSRNSKI